MKPTKGNGQSNVKKRRVNQGKGKRKPPKSPPKKHNGATKYA